MKSQPAKAVKGMNIRARLVEGGLILATCFTLYLFLALVTYHQNDPAWSTTGLGETTANAAGRVGAWLADVVLSVFGYLGYLLPFLLTGVLFLLFRLHIHKPSKAALALWSVGSILVLMAASSLIALYAPMQSHLVPMDGSGILGAWLSQSLLGLLNQWGATLLLVACLLGGLTLLSGISWLRLGRMTFQQMVRALLVSGKSITKVKLPRLSLSLPQKSKAMMNKWREEDDLDADQKEPVLNAAPIQEKPAPKKTENFTVPRMIQSVDAPSIPSVIQRAQANIPSLKKEPSPKGLPSLSLLDEVTKIKKAGYSQTDLDALSHNVEARLKEFGISVRVVGSCVGPVVTRFELELAPGMKVSRVTSLAKDLARALSTTSVRVVEVIPGKTVIGLEIPNQSREMVRLKEILESNTYQHAESLLTLALGKDIAGHAVTLDVAKMPHLLVAGTTGSGKSVSVNAMLLSILLKAGPEDVRLLMIDPKMLELSIYEGIPHLLAPVVTDMREAANVLRWCVAEMDRRYRVMSSQSVRNLAGFNAKVKEAQRAGQPIKDPTAPVSDNMPPVFLQTLPQIVVVIDELADMMMVVGKKVEDLIARIAQKARAAGIHMILATQRPSVDVITGLIKANVPARIAFQVSSRIDSRTILDQQGAEHLLGHGDMLYLPPGTSLPIRVHGAFVSDEEVLRVVAAWKERGAPDYLEEITQDEEERSEVQDDMSDAEQDPLYDQAVELVLKTRRASISLVQRRMKIGYNRASRLIEAMEAAGLVSGMDHNGLREVIVPNMGE